MSLRAVVALEVFNQRRIKNVRPFKQSYWLESAPVNEFIHHTPCYNLFLIESGAVAIQLSLSKAKF